MGEVSDEEEFYENIEAPKFVDFKATDTNHTDDGYWFCSRVGCDRKHEEELDHETISKNFFLRIMAARSPNVKFQKAINNRIIEQCPLSVPAKPSKSRVSRLVQISLFPQKKTVIDEAEKVEPLINFCATSKSKRKQVASRYLTSTKVDKKSPLRGGQDLKPENLEAVSKTLVFKSPKNVISEKTTLELCSPLTKIGAKMKKLDVPSQWKRMLGYSKKTPTETDFAGPSKKQVGDCKGKSTTRELSKIWNSDNPNRVTNKKSCSIANQKVKSESTQRGIDLKSRKDCNLGSERNAREERLMKKIPSSKASISGRKMNFSSSEDHHLDEDDKENFSASNGESRRDFRQDRNFDGRNIPSNQKAKVITQKTTPASSKQETKLKEQASEYKRPKPTNPKPFRLRTDERGILKESNSDRVSQTPSHPNECQDVSVHPGETMQRRLRVEKNTAKDIASGKKVDKCIQKIKPLQGNDSKTSERRVHQKLVARTPHRLHNSVQHKPIPVKSGKK